MLHIDLRPETAECLAQFAALAEVPQEDIALSPSSRRRPGSIGPKRGAAGNAARLPQPALPETVVLTAAWIPASAGMTA